MEFSQVALLVACVTLGLALAVVGHSIVNAARHLGRIADALEWANERVHSQDRDTEYKRRHGVSQ